MSNKDQDEYGSSGTPISAKVNNHKSGKTHDAKPFGKIKHD